MSLQCTSEPISWLELERHALGESTRAEAISDHLRECPGCEAAASSIRGDSRSMPGLQVPVATRRTRKWHWLLPLVPAVLLLLVWIGRPTDKETTAPGVKGGESSMRLLRESGGELLDARFFAPGDRFKVQVSCAPGERSARVVVIQGAEEFLPLAQATVECGNELVLPGAFTLEGGPAEVCVTLDQSEPMCVLVAPQP